jgi:hypothetical protein
MHFIYKWRKKRRFLTLHSQPPRRLRAPRPRHRSRRLATSASIRNVLREKTASFQFPVNDDLPRQAWDKHEDRLLSISYDKSDDLPRQAGTSITNGIKSEREGEDGLRTLFASGFSATCKKAVSYQ